jgi:hypothetical protein
MFEIILNRLRGTGDIFKIFSFAITGTIIYAIYIALVISGLTYFLNIPLLFDSISFVKDGVTHTFINTVGINTSIVAFVSASLFMLGESMGWGKWVGSLTRWEPFTEDLLNYQYNDNEGVKFPFVHKTANLITKEQVKGSFDVKVKQYLKYCNIALALRGFYWWVLLYLFIAFVGFINYYEALIISILLGISFPVAAFISKKLDYNGKLWIVNYSRGWENQELVYGFFQGLAMAYVIVSAC